MKPDRRHYCSGAPWEPIVGYSRAVRVGAHVYVSGTTSAGPDGVVHAPDDPYGQARLILQKIERALHEVGCRLQHVVRTRTYLTRIDDWPEVARADAECFRQIRPAATMLAVTAMVDPAMRVEIEVDAVVDGDPA